MPELPDVEIFKNYLDKNGLRKRIARVEIKDKRILNVDTDTLKNKITGQTFRKSRRIGKHLLVNYGGDEWLAFHFGMTGYFEKRKVGDSHNYTALSFQFDNDEELDYVSRRKLGKVDLTRGVEDFVKEKDLGPDALQIDGDTFRQRVREKGGKLKVRLMDQNLVAGIGNIYSDEILYQEKLHPEKK